MPIVCIFNIGTWHSHTEDENVLVKLWKDCAYTDLGVIQNQNDGKNDNVPLERLGSVGAYSNSKWINDGADGFPGESILVQTESNIKVLTMIATKSRLDRVVLVGHSRGAILAVRIAAWLHKTFKNDPVPCYLFLYDPVKRLWRGTDYYNREIHTNVKRISVIVMEDQSEWDFKLLSIKRRGWKRRNIETSEYTRLPGTHGTATQVTGHPIGQVGYILALNWLRSCGVQVNNALTDEHLLRAYCEIPRKNKITVIGGVKYRTVNDFEEQKKLKMKRTGVFKQGEKDVKLGGDRTQKLDRVAGPNRFMGTQFFVNEDHYNRFSARYPCLANAINGDMSRITPISGELDRLQTHDYNTYKWICDNYFTKKN